MRTREELIIGHLADVVRLQPLKETGSLGNMEFRVARFDAKIKAVGSGMNKALYVKDGMMGLGQTVQRQHTEYGENGSAQHGHLKGDGDERRPAIERSPANVQRKCYDVHP